MKAQMAEKKADKAVGRTKGGWNTKLHAVVDGLGNPVEFLLSAGNDHDSVHAVELLKKVRIGGSAVLADRAYGARVIREYISAHGASYAIPPQSNVSDPWPVDWLLYKERHLVECFSRKSSGSAGLHHPHPSIYTIKLYFPLIESNLKNQKRAKPPFK